jgi:hypothetical protein
MKIQMKTTSTCQTQHLNLSSFYMEQSIYLCLNAGLGLLLQDCNHLVQICYGIFSFLISFYGFHYPFI